MKMEVSCNVCKDILGTLEKKLITDKDSILYQLMMYCNKRTKKDVEDGQQKLKVKIYD